MKAIKFFIPLILVAAAGGAFAQPTIGSGGILNVASYAYQGLPNSSIAQGSIFAIFGTGMGPTTGVKVYQYPLSPDSFQGTSVTVTVNGTTVKVPVLFTQAGQVNAMLPSSTPVGTGTLTVSYNGVSSAPAPITVTAHSFGMFTTNQAGSGQGVVMTPAYALNGANNSAHPGDALIVWGTGLGPVTGDENAGPTPGNMPSLPLTVYVGNTTAQVTYQGRSGCCSGVDQVVFTVPQGVEGCNVPVTVKIGNVVSNYGTIAIAQSGVTCPVSSSSFAGIDLGMFQSTHDAKIGSVMLDRSSSTGPGLPPPLGDGKPTTTTTDNGSANFEHFTYTDYSQLLSSLSTLNFGACTVWIFKDSQTPSSSGGSATTVWLDAGPQITVSGPNGVKQLTQLQGGGVGIYDAQLGGGTVGSAGYGPLYLSQGSYTITGPGGKDVGPFSATINLPQALTWTDQASITAVNRAQGVTVHWTGGDPSGIVLITGYSINVPDINNPNVSAGAGFFCTAQVSAGQFTVPPVVLLSLPPSTSINESGFSFTMGSLGVGSMAQWTTFKASGLDLGYISSEDINSSIVPYQ